MPRITYPSDLSKVTKIHDVRKVASIDPKHILASSGVIWYENAPTFI